MNIFGNKICNKVDGGLIQTISAKDFDACCRLGYLYMLYTQNANECMNPIIKAKQDPNSLKH